jgi:hypothetical protein
MYVFWISKLQDFIAVQPPQGNCRVRKHRTAQLPLRSSERDSIFGVIGVKIPDTGPDKPRFELEYGSRDIFRRVGPTRVQGKTPNRSDRAHQKIEQI